MAILKDKYYKIGPLSKELGVDRRTIRDSLEDRKIDGIPFLRVGKQKQAVVLGEDVLRVFSSTK